MTSLNAPRWARVAATIAALVPLSIAATVGAAYANDDALPEEEALVVETPVDAPETPETPEAPEAPVEEAPAPPAEAAPAPVPVPEPAASTNDPTDPTTTITMSQPPIPSERNGWHNGPVDVTVGATVGQGRIVSIDWFLSGASTGSGSSPTSPATVHVPNDGVTTVTVLVTDSAENISEQDFTVRVDGGNPVMTIASPLPDQEFEVGEAIPLEFSCDDPSGIVMCAYMPTEGGSQPSGSTITFDEAGQRILYFMARDGSSHLAQPSVTVRIVEPAPEPDVTAPVLSLVADEPVPDTGWYTKAINVKVTAVDESVIQSIQSRYALSGGGWSEWAVLAPNQTGKTELEGNMQFFASGQYRYEFRSADEHGNVSETLAYTHRVDKEIYPASITGFRSELVLGEHYAPQFDCADMMSGTSTCSSSNGPSGTPLPTDTAGDHTFTTTHSDVAGNSVTTTWTYTVVADTTLPVVTTTSSASGWTADESVDVEIRATDDSRVASVWVQATGADAMPLRSVEGDTFFFTASTEGVTTITAYALDSAGNRSADVTYTVRIDRTLPTVTITSPANRVDSLVATTDFTVGQVVDLEFECADAGSGIASCAATGGATALPTTTAGEHSIDVVAVDAAGNRSVRTLDYPVIPAPAEEPQENPGGNPGNDPKPAPQPVGVLAFTGLEIWAGLALVAALFAAGVVALTASRSRRS